MHHEADMKVEENYLRKFREHSVATALASRVLPVPGGPYSNTPKYEKNIKSIINAQNTLNNPEERLIDCMKFNAIFNSVLVISLRPMHLPMPFWSSFNWFFAQYSFQATGCFPTQSLLKQWTAMREEWILSQWLSLILGKNTAKAKDWTNNILFSSPVRYQLSYGARLNNPEKHNVWKQSVKQRNCF